jgi:hypothetical protein
MKGCRLQSRGLLKAVFGEKHAVGEVAKLLAGATPKLGLSQHSGHQPRGITLGTQGTNQLDHIGFGVEVSD